MSMLEDHVRKIIVFALMALALLIAFYGGAFESSVNTDTRQSEFNRADVMFMRMMIIHHDQAVKMAEMASERTDNENILELSENISEAQRRENEKMADWLNDIGINRPTTGHRMAGMASSQEMSQLNQSEGREFDLLFSELMIEHHRGGIQMAKMEVQNGKSEKVRELAQGMVEAQQKEIESMEEWRKGW